MDHAEIAATGAHTKKKKKLKLNKLNMLDADLR